MCTHVRAETDILGYPIHDTEPFRILTNYFRQFGNVLRISK